MSYINLNTAPYSYAFISGLSFKDRMECSKRESVSFRSFEACVLPDQRECMQRRQKEEVTDINAPSGARGRTESQAAASEVQENTHDTTYPAFKALSVFSNIWRSIQTGFGATFLYTWEPECHSTHVDDDLIGPSFGLDSQFGLGMLGRRGCFSATGLK